MDFNTAGDRDMLALIPPNRPPPPTISEIPISVLESYRDTIFPLEVRYPFRQILRLDDAENWVSMRALWLFVICMPDHIIPERTIEMEDVTVDQLRTYRSFLLPETLLNNPAGPVLPLDDYRQWLDLRHFRRYIYSLNALPTLLSAPPSLYDWLVLTRRVPDQAGYIRDVTEFSIDQDAGRDTSSSSHMRIPEQLEYVPDVVIGDSIHQDARSDTASSSDRGVPERTICVQDVTPGLSIHHDTGSDTSSSSGVRVSERTAYVLDVTGDSIYQDPGGDASASSSSTLSSPSS